MLYPTGGLAFSEAARLNKKAPLAELTLPLRGLAGEGAQKIVDMALADAPGVLRARASIVDQLLTIVYDPQQTSPAEIHEALGRAGIVHVTDAGKG